MADFGVVITIGVAVGVDIYLGFDTPKLMVPLKFEVRFDEMKLTWVDIEIRLTIDFNFI